MQLSCVTATPALSNRERFPNYFQFLPSMVDFAPAYFGIIKKFKWRHVVILLQNENLYTVVRVTWSQHWSAYIPCSKLRPLPFFIKWKWPVFSYSCVYCKEWHNCLQTVDRLKDMLVKENKTYTVDLFYSAEGLASLSREPFLVIDSFLYFFALTNIII